MPARPQPTGAAVLAWRLETLAVVLLVMSGSAPFMYYFFFVLAHQHDDASSRDDDDDDDDDNENNEKETNTIIVQMAVLAGGLLLAQGAGSSLLLLLNNSNDATTCCRAAAVTTALTGLSLTVGSSLFLVPHSNDGSSNFITSAVLRPILVAVGMTLFALSSASLMASFWPAVAPRQEQEPSLTANNNPEEHGNDEVQPLLPSSVVEAFASSPSPSERNLIDQEAVMTPGGFYQLMEESFEHHQNEETPATTVNRKPASAEKSDINDEDEEAQQQTTADEQERPISPESTADAVIEVDENTSENEDDQQQEQSSNSRIRGTRRLLQLAASELLYLYAGCIVLLFRLPFSLAMPHFVSTTLAALAAANFAAARREIALLFLAGTLDAALDFWGFFLFGYANQRIVRGLRVDLFRRLLGQEVAFFDEHSSGELASRLNSDCSEMAGDLTWFFRFSIESAVRITGITAYMLIRSPMLGACALSIVPAVAVINKLYGDWLRQNAVQVQDALAEANSVAQEALANVRTVIAFAAERKECTRYESRIERQYLLNVKQLYMTAAYYMIVNTFLINTIVQGILLWIGMLLIEGDRLAPGVLLAFMLYQSQLQNETMNLMNSYTSLIKSSGAGDKVFALLDRSPPQPSTGFAESNYDFDVDAGRAEDGDVSPRSETPDSNHAHIQSKQQFDFVLENVSFRYPSRPESLVLDNMDLEIPRGKTIALVGKSGCGKSTIVGLLQRFYDPTKGRILVNGVDLRNVNLRDHRRQIGVVTQDPALFRGSLWDNIAYGCADDVSEAEIARAARLAHADSFIREFGDGFQTSVGERGVQLSGGQKQRIAIARAVALQHGQPSLLLLDEATSALDYASETAVQDALDQLLKQNKDMTTVIVAHRLRTVQNADRIVVLQDGRVVEQGTHEELLQAGGVYREMVARADSKGVLPES